MQRFEQLGICMGISFRTMGITVISPLFWLTLWFTYRFYLQYEWDKASAIRLALASSLEGIVAGFFIIYLTTVLGFVIRPGIVLYFMGPMAMLLSLWRSRFLCLSYGAGILLVLCTLLHVPVDCVGICGLVGILHLAEGVLVLLVGGRYTTTIYQCDGGKMVEERGIYRFWPIPVGLLVAWQMGTGNWIEMPQWWPLLQDAQDLSILKEVDCQGFGLLPLAASLGYSDRTGIKWNVKKRRIWNGGLILGYATILLGMCVIVTRWNQWEAVMILWMVLGHEAIIVLADLFTKN